MKKMDTLEKLSSTIGGIVNRLSLSSTEKKQLETELLQSVNATLDETNKQSGTLIETEMKGIWLQRAWRPIVMLTLTGVVVIGAFTDLPMLESGSQFWDLLQLGLGGYVIGRSAEKITGTYFKNRKR